MTIYHSDTPQEQWKSIPGYEGIYEASTFGRIRTSANKLTYTERHGYRHWKQRILSGRGDNYKTGYRVVLWKDGYPKEFLVSRLVAMTWVDGYKEELTVNHINGNRHDNRIQNLEWVTRGENITKGFEIGLYSTAKPIAMQNIENPDETLVFNSMSNASLFLGHNVGYLSNEIRKGRTIFGKYKVCF